MGSLTGSIDLLKLSRAGVTTINNLQCLVIPVAENDIFILPDSVSGKPKGAYLNLNVWENRNGANQYGNTHYIKQSFSKTFREQAGEDALKAKPYLGNMKPNSLGTQQPPFPMDGQSASSYNAEDLPF